MVSETIFKKIKKIELVYIGSRGYRLKKGVI